MNYFNARETLAESWRNRLPRLRGEAPGGNWVGIEVFGMPINESQSESCHFGSGSAGAAEVRCATASAASPVPHATESDQ